MFCPLFFSMISFTAKPSASERVIKEISYFFRIISSLLILRLVHISGIGFRGQPPRLQFRKLKRRFFPAFFFVIAAFFALFFIAGSGGNQTADDDVFFQAAQIIFGSFRGGVDQNARSFLERGGRKKAFRRQSDSRDAKQKLFGPGQLFAGFFISRFIRKRPISPPRLR